VRAGADQHEPLGLARLVTVFVLLRIGHARAVIANGLGDLRASPIADEQRLAAPLDGDLLAFLDLGQVEFDRRQRQRIAGRVHLVDERPGEARDSAAGRSRRRNMNEITPVRVVARGMRIGICARDGVGHLEATLR